jgi:hypothetical protein
MITLERGFKFSNMFYDLQIVNSMNSKEIGLLINRVDSEIALITHQIVPFSEAIKNKEVFPEYIRGKVRYKDALIYFVKDLKECLFYKEKEVPVKFMEICKERLSEEDYNDILNEALEG